MRGSKQSGEKISNASIFDSIFGRNKKIKQGGTRFFARNKYYGF